MDFNKLWNWLIGKPVSNEALLVLEEERLAKLREAVRVAKEKAELHRQLLTARRDSKELEEALGKRSRARVYIIGLGTLLLIIIVIKACM